MLFDHREKNHSDVRKGKENFKNKMCRMCFEIVLLIGKERLIAFFRATSLISHCSESPSNTIFT